MPNSDADIRHTNYISKNLLFNTLLKHFLNRVGDLLKSINAIGKNGLDAGCGEGHMLGYLHEQGAIGRLTAIDLNPEHLNFAKERFPYFDYQVADLCYLPFSDDTFDFVMSTEVLEHLPNPGRALMELKRIAKPEAYLIISVPFEPFFHWGNLLRGKYWKRGGYTPDHRNFWHRHQFSAFLSPIVEIEADFGFKTFPWLLYACRFR